MKKIITKNEKETFDFAKEFTKELKGGDVIGLLGNLGAGKTVFSQGVAKELGIKEKINSPTFVYMKIYDVKNHPTIKKFCHIDAYRLEDEAKLINIGAIEYVGEPSVLTLIEWSDKQKIFKYRKIILEIKNGLREIRVNHR